MSRQKLLKETILLASADTHLTRVVNNNKDFVKITGGVAYMAPVDGWVGVSVFLCAWKPLVEVNILRFPEVTKVVWINDDEEWKKIK
jgi:hypothetical protein